MNDHKEMETAVEKIAVEIINISENLNNVDLAVFCSRTKVTISSILEERIAKRVNEVSDMESQILEMRNALSFIKNGEHKQTLEYKTAKPSLNV